MWITTTRSDARSIEARNESYCYGNGKYPLPCMLPGEHTGIDPFPAPNVKHHDRNFRIHHGHCIALHPTARSTDSWYLSADAVVSRFRLDHPIRLRLSSAGMLCLFVN